MRASTSKQAKRNTSHSHPSSSTNYRFLSKDELTDRLRATHTLQRNTQQKLERLRERIVETVEKNGVEVDEETNDDLLKVMETCSKDGLVKHPQDSIQHVFWQQQLQCARLANPRQRRWHPLMIKWALYLRHLSSKAYETVRDSGVIALPSQRTLRDYTHFIQSSMGFSEEVDQQLMEAAKVTESLED